MGTGIDLRTFFQKTYSVNDVGVENIFDFINASIAVAALEKPAEFQERRRRIIEAILMASPLDGMDHDDDYEISSSSNTSCHCPDDQDQFEEIMTSSKPTNLGAKEKDCGTSRSVADDEEKNKGGKKLQRKIGTEDAKQKVDARSQNKGSGSNEGKFDATKRKFEETSLHVKKAKRTVQFLDQVEELSSKPSSSNLGAKEKDCETIRSARADDEEKKKEGKKLQRKIGTEDSKKKADARSQNKASGSGSRSNEGKFETTKRKFEESSLHAKKAKRTIQLVDFKDIPQPERAVNGNRCRSGGFKNSSFRRR